jgi:hypothetical protein
VIDRAQPVRFAKRQALVVRDRDVDRIGKAAGEVGLSRQVEPPVRRGEERHAEAAEQRQGRPVNVAMDDVESPGGAPHRFEQVGDAKESGCALDQVPVRLDAERIHHQREWCQDLGDAAAIERRADVGEMRAAEPTGALCRMRSIAYRPISGSYCSSG